MKDTLLVEQDVAIPMRDGSILRANVYRSSIAENSPVIMTVGPYGKDASFEERNPDAYALIAEHGPYLNWETPNPEWWVSRGYAVVRVDQRGIGSSAGRLDLFSEQQSEDYYDAIEWAAQQPWSNGKVGLLGVSYYALTQWQVAALQPPHLAAIIPWEGLVELYRDATRHGGILSNTFLYFWYQGVLRIQHGADGSLSQEERMANRAELPSNVKKHLLDDTYYRTRTPDLSCITVPLLSVGNWGGVGLHLRGNVEGYLGAASEYKWLRIHVGNHFTPFYSEEGRALQARFFDYWLKGVENGLLDDARVQLAIRKGSGFTWRNEHEWPLQRTKWTRFYLNAANQSIDEPIPDASSRVNYSAPEGGVTFTTTPFTQDTEVTGPLALRLWVSSTTTDMDLFVTIRNIDAQGNDVPCIGSNNEAAPVTKGWLRTSHRKLDSERTNAYRPYHSHDEIQKLSSEEIVAVDVEIWPTSMVFEAGHRLALDIETHDGIGSGMYHHNDQEDRNPSLLAGINTIHTGGEYPSFLLLPIIP